MKILLAGEGGQGVQVAAEILAHAAFLENKPASLIPNFGVEQRGGVSVAFVIIGEDASYPKFDQADILAIFCDRAWERVKRYVGTQTKIIAGPAVTKRMMEKQWFMVNGENLEEKVWNMRLVGEIVSLTAVVKKESLKQVLEERFKDKFTQNPSLREMNLQALT